MLITLLQLQLNKGLGLSLGVKQVWKRLGLAKIQTCVGPFLTPWPSRSYDPVNRTQGSQQLPNIYRAKNYLIFWWRIFTFWEIFFLMLFCGWCRSFRLRLLRRFSGDIPRFLVRFHNFGGWLFLSPPSFLFLRLQKLHLFSHRQRHENHLEINSFGAKIDLLERL